MTRLPHLFLFLPFLTTLIAGGDEGTLLEPKGRQILHLAGDVGQPGELERYRDMVGSSYRPAGKNLWLGFGGPRPWDFQMRALEKGLTELRRAGCIANVGLGFSSDRLGRFGTAHDDAVADTDRYDADIDAMADVMKRVGTPAFLRIGVEINGSWKGLHPWIFPRAYRKIVARFRARQVENVAFVFCVVANGDPDVFERNQSGEWKWFPGDDVIDWYGIDLFERYQFDEKAFEGRREAASTFARFTEMFLDRAKQAGKPVILGEVTPVGHTIPATRDDPRGRQAAVIWDEWFEPFLNFLDDHPEIKAVNYLPVEWRRTRNWKDWGDARIHESSYLSRKWRQELSKSRWVHQPSLAQVVDLPERETD